MKRSCKCQRNTSELHLLHVKYLVTLSVVFYTCRSDPADVSLLVKNYGSPMTEGALTPRPPAVISPATCRRVFTISGGLREITWEPPAWRKTKTKK